MYSQWNVQFRDMLNVIVEAIDKESGQPLQREEFSDILIRLNQGMPVNLASVVLGVKIYYQDTSQ